VSEVQRTTGYAPDLFETHETSSANVKDKDAKVAYLTKIIACVAIDSGEPNPIARPLKIVAGLEPERTNAFLQALATCAAKGDGRDAARRAKRGETAAEKKNSFQPDSSETANRAPPGGPSVPTTSFDPFAGGSDAPRAAPRAAPHADAGSTGSTRLSPSLERSSLDVDAPSKSARQAIATRPLSARRPPPRPKPEPPISPVSAAPTNDPNRGGEKETNGARGGGAILGEDDASDSSDDDAIVGDGLEGLDEDAGVNPWSAARGASGSPGASKAGGALVRDMLAAKREGDASLRARGGDAGGADAGDGGGGIILGSRRRRKTAAAAEARGEETETSSGVGTSLPLGADVFMDSDTRASDTTNDASNAKGIGTDDASLPGSAGLADLGAARDATQALVRSTNPLGRAMDALAEDAESMRVELRFWRRERAKHARRVKEDRADTPSAEKGEGNAERTGGAPSAAEEAAAQTEADIKRVAEKIQAARLDVAANDATIAKLLAMVVTPS